MRRSRSSVLPPHIDARTPFEREQAMKLTHDTIEKNVGWLIVLTVLVISVGGR